MRIFLVSALFLAAAVSQACAQEHELKTLNLGDDASYWGPVFIHYVPALTKIVNEPIANEWGGKMIRVAELRLSPRSKDVLLIEYSEGASADPMFIIYRIEDAGPRQLGNAIMGLELEAPGDGCFYVRGHTNSWFDKRRKFTSEGGYLREVRQPFYYVGLETKTLAQIAIHGNQGGSEFTQLIPKETPVTVVLNDGDSFLLKVDHDVLGWWRPKNMSSQQRAEEIEGIYLKGD